MKKSIIISALFLCAAHASWADSAKTLVVQSPDGKQVVRFWQKENADHTRTLLYDVNYGGRTVIGESQAGLQLDNKVWEQALAKKIVQPACWMDNFEVDSVSHTSFDDTWMPVLGERATVRLAAKHGLMVNIHDEFRPSGFSRTYPNLVTQEGIRGNEEFPDATHNTVLPFTRLINGAAIRLTPATKADLKACKKYRGQEL